MNGKTYSVGSRHFSGNINPEILEKNNPKTKRRIKVLRSKCDICGKNKSQIFNICKLVDMMNLKKRKMFSWSL